MPAESKIHDNESLRTLTIKLREAILAAQDKIDEEDRVIDEIQESAGLVATPTRPIRAELRATHRDANPLQAIDDLPRHRPLPGVSSTRIAAAMTAHAIQRELDARLMALAATHEEGHA